MPDMALNLAGRLPETGAPLPLAPVTTHPPGPPGAGWESIAWDRCQLLDGDQLTGGPRQDGGGPHARCLLSSQWTCHVWVRNLGHESKVPSSLPSGPCSPPRPPTAAGSDLCPTTFQHHHHNQFQSREERARRRQSEETAETGEHGTHHRNRCC